jgi:hypothetical protein
LSEHFRAAHAHALAFVAFDEGLIDEAWLAKKPKWQRYEGLPVSFVTAWRRS